MPIVRDCPSCGKPNRVPAKHLSDNGRCGACKAALNAMAEPIEVRTAEFDEIIRESKVPVLVISGLRGAVRAEWLLRTFPRLRAISPGVRSC